MDIVTLVLVMLLAVVVSNYIARLSPLPLPLPLLQIALGALLAHGMHFEVELEPEIFFLVFLPPLLFLDGWRIPKRGFFRDGWTILALALGLVVFTVLGMGLFIHWLIPAMPLAVAFALAAVLSPTDPIAVSSVAARVPIPHRLMHILEGESLLNDASGLVCLRFAVAAALTGTFSLAEASVTFLQLALGGVAIGVAVTVAVSFVQKRLLRHAGEDPGIQTLVSLLIPFGAYLAAEQMHTSGILAAVAAGIAMNYVENLGIALAVTRMRRAAVWDTVQLAANGAIFILLGEQLPRILASAAETVNQAEHHDESWLALYVVAITLGLAALRFTWVWISVQFVLLHASQKGQPVERPSWHLVAVMALAGVKGAITLAGVLTLPLVSLDGTPFPARDLAIFLAMGVILLSLVVASLSLPPLLRRLRLPPQPSHEHEEDEARGAAARAAIRAIERVQHELAEGRDDADLFAEAASQAMEPYHRSSDTRAQEPEEQERAQRRVAVERHLRLVGLRAERDELYHLRRARHIEDETLRRLVREIDLTEARYAS
ncbi:Na+/H+ antiporter [Roseomonas gilardii]|uniref:Na+/H+ antiporter n=1 Tax=Roseomonas gilardii TaxID=257708 RepID=UPI00119CA9A5|nr:Na+/H+ antiporter [Roseomonas gilardii]